VVGSECLAWAKRGGQSVPHLTDAQREAMMALKDGSLPARIFNAAHKDPSVSALIPTMIEMNTRQTADGPEVAASLTQKGHIALLALGRDRGVVQAADMAGQMIDFLGDPSATAEDREKRKRSLMRGPLEFRAIRHDVTGSKG
jgi:hypothetical protein